MRYESVQKEVRVRVKIRVCLFKIWHVYFSRFKVRDSCRFVF